MDGSEREVLRRELLELGFDEVRFARAGAISGPGLRKWLDNGWHADMAWMERTADKRVDPDRVLDGVGTVILFGVNMATPRII